MPTEPTRDFASEFPPTADLPVDRATLTSDQAGEHSDGGQTELTPPGYVLLEEIGRGGMGIVYRARDTGLDRDVAVKVLQHRYATNGLAARRFLEEARITGRLQHPGIPPVHQVGTLPNGRPFLAMKLIKGRTLADILADELTDRGSLVAVFEQLCHTVGYSHAHGVIHRDLKPSNVMVGAFGEVQVMDWGLAKQVESGQWTVDSNSEDCSSLPTNHSPLSTAQGQVMGTPAFMAPEQASAASDQIDQRSDVFGLGAVLCVILTRRPPFAGSNPESTRQMAAAGKLEDAFSRLAGCGAEPELVSLCKRCLSPEREHRPADGVAVANAVQAFRADAEARARRAELHRAKVEVQAREQRKRRTVQLALLSALAVLVLGAGAFAWWRDRTQTEQAFKTEQARERVKGLMSFATDARKEYRFTAAQDALTQAAELAGNLAPDMIADVERAAANLAFVRELDAIRLKRSLWIPTARDLGRFDHASAPPAYRAAFASRGLDVVADPEDAGNRIAASPVRSDLVTALDDWAILEGDEAVRERVLLALQRADPNSGVTPFRDPKVWNDHDRLQKLAAQVDLTRLSPGAIVAIAEVIRHQGANAAPLLRHAMALHPREFLIPFLLGQVLLDDTERLGAYRAARAIRPDNVVVLINLGTLLRATGDLDGAIVTFRQAIALDPGFALGHFNLGATLFAKRDVKGAIDVFRQAIALDPTDAQAYCGLGGVLGETGELDEAIRVLRQAVTLDANNAKTHLNLGTALSAKGDLDGSILAFQRSISLDAQSPVAQYNLGTVLLKKRNLDAAIAAFTQAVNLDPKYVAAHYSLGIALGGTGRLDGSIAAYHDVIRLDPNHAEAHCNLGQMLRLQGRLAEGLSFLKRGHELGSKRPGWPYPSAKWVADCERLLAEQQAKTAPFPREVKR